MGGMILIAACLIFIDRLCFRGQLVSLFVDGCRDLLRPSRAAPPEVPSPPVTTPPELPIIIQKHYMIGLDMSAADTEVKKEQSVNRDVIFAAPPKNFASWDELEAWKNKAEDWDYNEPEEPPTVDFTPTDLPDDTTEEERFEVREFDLNAFQ